MDLHIHTCLSPCGEKQMVPSKIIGQAKKMGLDVIGICDHNTAENVVAVKKAGKKESLVMGGMEVTSREEVHILALFDNNEDLFSLQQIVYENLHGKNDTRVFGEQIIVDEKDEIIGTNQRLLIGATDLTVDKIVDTVHFLNGLCFASHIDRERFSIIGQLGFIPDGLKLDAAEVSPKTITSEFNQTYGVPLVTFSDAHTIQDIGNSYTEFLINEPSVAEIKKALLNEDGRFITTYFRHSREFN